MNVDKDLRAKPGLKDKEEGDSVEKSRKRRMEDSTLALAHGGLCPPIYWTVGMEACLE